MTESPRSDDLVGHAPCRAGSPYVCKKGRARDGAIVPVEVKSGSRPRARSLRPYVARYEPRRAIKLIGGPGGDGDGRVEAWPLYYAQHLRDL